MKVFAKAGVTIEPGQAARFTGNLGTGALSGAAEVDYPAVNGGIAHLVAGPTAITDAAIAEDHTEIANFVQVQTFGTVAAGDILSVRTDGRYETRSGIKTAAGQALTADAGGQCSAAVFLGPTRQSVIAVGTTADPTEAGAVAVPIPEMTATLTLRSGTGITCVANVNLDIQSGDEVETSIWVVDSGSVATEIANTRSLTSTVGKVRVPVTTQIAPTEITGPTPHTVQLRWRAITGTARAVATNRRLFAAEF